MKQYYTIDGHDVTVTHELNGGMGWRVAIYIDANRTPIARYTDSQPDEDEVINHALNKASNFLRGRKAIQKAKAIGVKRTFATPKGYVEGVRNLAVARNLLRKG